jgi:hypothetical protein
MTAAVAQDFMCEPFMLKKTGLTVPDHHRLTIERYDALLDFDPGVRIMPVLQGFEPVDYSRHLEAYGERLTPGMWVGVGSVCKRNGSPGDVVHVLSIIKSERPDLLLHGFGLKTTALMDPCVIAMLETADSMAWSFSAKSQAHVVIRQLQRELGRNLKPSEARRICAARGLPIRNPNDWREAKAFADRVASVSASGETAWQLPLPLSAA